MTFLCQLIVTNLSTDCRQVSVDRGAYGLGLCGLGLNPVCGRNAVFVFRTASLCTKRRHPTFMKIMQ